MCLIAGLASAQYLITTPDSLLNNGADYLVITHDTFTDAVYPLCALRDSLGLSVKMAEVSLIYSVFPNWPRPDRIRAFMERMYGYWSPRPQYVLLVGDASKDTTSRDYVPAKRMPKFSYYYAGGLTEHGADCWYATLAGADSTPDVIIGRLPVNKPAQAESVVAKILRYETGTDTGRWTSTILEVVSTDRQQYATELETTFFRPAGDSVYTVYESQGQSAFLRHKTLVGFNQGAAIVAQCSHGSQPPAWTGSRTLFSYQDVDSLFNLDRLPFVIGRG
jgi:hypothetical protein